ncbi:hypothetical protein [Malikia spinosa]|uniref:Uncharacterized protein n=1 Tax=Malikia spinosa TaxID=86180 RepID=A0A7C9IZA7_9BURK|nr:hypothetical protein [Malikia spinosa]MYZ53734.1 hypothetical protein [Malikia spinosa]
MSGCGCKCGPQQAAQQQFGSDAAGDAFEPDFGLPEAGGQSAVELFVALTEAGAEASAASEADQELAEVALEDELAAQQELDEVLAEAESEGGEAVEPGLDELLALLKNRPGLKLTLSY